MKIVVVCAGREVFADAEALRLDLKNSKPAKGELRSAARRPVPLADLKALDGVAGRFQPPVAKRSSVIFGGANQCEGYGD